MRKRQELDGSLRMTERQYFHWGAVARRGKRPRVLGEVRFEFMGNLPHGVEAMGLMLSREWCRPPLPREPTEVTAAPMASASEAASRRSLLSISPSASRLCTSPSASRRSLLPPIPRRIKSGIQRSNTNWRGRREMDERYGQATAARITAERCRVRTPVICPRGRGQPLPAQCQDP